jgi:hypothetical protein
MGPDAADEINPRILQVGDQQLGTDAADDVPSGLSVVGRMDLEVGPHEPARDHPSDIGLRFAQDNMDRHERVPRRNSGAADVQT